MLLNKVFDRLFCPKRRKYESSVFESNVVMASSAAYCRDEALLTFFLLASVTLLARQKDGWQKGYIVLVLSSKSR